MNIVIPCSMPHPEGVAIIDPVGKSSTRCSLFKKKILLFQLYHTRTLMTGIGGKSSLSRESIIIPACMSHRAPSIRSPCTYAPSFGAALESAKL